MGKSDVKNKADEPFPRAFCYLTLTAIARTLQSPSLVLNFVHVLYMYQKSH